jgi:indole-3-glycerol phosphate synthase
VTVLDRIVEATREEVRRRSREVPLAQLEARIDPRDDRPFTQALVRPGVSVIAEHKRRSPSAGAIGPERPLGDVVRAYERGGAAALSVLTEGPHFGGSLDDLRAARDGCALPVLRKDFVVDPYQVYETAAWGADAMLLIVAALEPDALAALHREARGLDLDVLVEVHSEEELECALEVVDADVIGINNRDLADFSVDVQRTFDLLADVPAGKTVVSESGFHSREQLDELERVGVDAVLVGESLMRAPEPESALRALTGAAPPGESTDAADAL